MTDCNLSTKDRERLLDICSDEIFIEFTQGMVSELTNNPYQTDKLPEPNKINSELQKISNVINKCSSETKRHISNTFAYKSGVIGIDLLSELQECLEKPYTRPKGKPGRRLISKFTAILFDQLDIELNTKEQGNLYRYLGFIIDKCNLEYDLEALAKDAINASKQAKEID